MAASFDRAQVVVWGGGSGGVAAALQAARLGASTLLLTPGRWLGGMVSAAGVCCPDGNELTPWQSGLWGALLRALQQREANGLDHNWVSCFGYRPQTAETILQAWVAAEPCLRWWPAVTLQAVERQGDRVSSLVIERDRQTIRLALDVLVDGSDRGDLLPLADAPYRLGWEAQELWQEPSAPPQQRLETEAFFRQQPVQSPTWVVLGQLTQEQAPPSLGNPELAAPFQQATAAFGLERTITYGRLPGGLVMLNWPLHGNDWHAGLDRAFACDPRQDAELASDMQAHSMAFAEALIDASGGWLHLADVFRRSDGAPAPALALMPYWREGRRMVGRSLVIEQQLLPQGPGEAIAALQLHGAAELDSIAVGNYANDHHYPGDDWPLAAKSCRWGGRWSGTPFTIPYGALVSATVSNLLAADKAFSTSHMANGATRLQPLILNIGQAAGCAAALAVQRGCDLAELPLRHLQQTLLADPLAPSAIAPLWDTPWHHPLWRQRQQAVLDDPSRLGSDGRWQGTSSDPAAPLDPGPQGCPAEPHERAWAGELISDGQGGYTLHLSEPDGISGRTSWPLITLEPALHRWLQTQQRPRSVRLLGCLNPWGPWLRVSRLAETGC